MWRYQPSPYALRSNPIHTGPQQLGCIARSHRAGVSLVKQSGPHSGVGRDRKHGGMLCCSRKRRSTLPRLLCRPHRRPSTAPRGHRPRRQPPDRFRCTRSAGRVCSRATPADCMLALTRPVSSRTKMPPRMPICCPGWPWSASRNTSTFQTGVSQQVLECVGSPVAGCSSSGQLCLRSTGPSGVFMQAVVFTRVRGCSMTAESSCATSWRCQGGLQPQP